MFFDEVLILELGAIDGFTTGSAPLDCIIPTLEGSVEIPVSSSKVTTLNHKPLDHTVESRSCDYLAFNNPNLGA